MGIGALLVWIGILYYVGFSYDNSDMQNTHGRSNNSPLWHFVCQQYYNPKSTIFKEDDTRPDRHLLYEQALGYTMTTTTTTSVTNKSSTDECKHSFINRSQFPRQQQRRRLQHQEEEGKGRCCCCYRHRQQIQSHQNQQYTSQNHNDNNTIQNSSNLLNNSINVDNLSNQTEQLQQGIEQINNNDGDDNHVNNVRNRMIEGVNEMTTTDESIISLNSRSVNV